MTCPGCQAPLVEGARFCGGCGMAFSATETQGGALAAAVAAGPREMLGREIAGRYRILAKLGEGGMGAVFRAEQISLKRAVALKVLRPEMSRDPGLLRRFNAEAELVAKLSHPNTVAIYDFGQDSDGSLFIAMELIEGASLRGVLRDAGPLPPLRALGIAAQIAASLADAHAHAIIHRDLKPDNVMLQDRGRERDIARVLDFGIAKLRDDTRATQLMTQAGDMLGTPQYMAPEQIRGEVIDGRTDVYALGCIVYEMLTGRMVFEAPTVMALLSKHLLELPQPPSQRRPDLAIAPALDALVLSAMAKVPAARPPTMEAYGETIAALLRAYRQAEPPRLAGPAAPRPVAPMPMPYVPTPRPPSLPAGYGGVTATNASVSGLAAARASAGPTEMVDPLPRPALVRGPNGVMQTSTVPLPPRSHLTLILVLVGAVVIAGIGIGVGVAVARRGVPGPERRVTPIKDTDDPDRAEPATPEGAPADPSGADPWSHPDGKDVPAAGERPTDVTPIPPGIVMNPPFAVRQPDEMGAQHWIDDGHEADYYLFPLLGGTNDPTLLANDWLGKHPTMRLEKKLAITSAGAPRWALLFTGKLPSPRGPVDAVQRIVLYIEPAYRVGVLVQAPAAAFKNDPAFIAQSDAFFTTGVVMP